MIHLTSRRHYLPAALLAAGLAVLPATITAHNAHSASTPVVSSHRVLLASRPSAKTLPHIRLKAGHSYLLSLDQMGHIVGASNPQLAPGTSTTVPAYRDDFGDAVPIGYWEVDLPNGVTTYTQGNTAGWNVSGSLNTMTMHIVVPANAIPGTGYFAIISAQTVQGAAGPDSVGPAVTFDVT